MNAFQKLKHTPLTILGSKETQKAISGGDAIHSSLEAYKKCYLDCIKKHEYNSLVFGACVYDCRKKYSACLKEECTFEVKL